MILNPGNVMYPGPGTDPGYITFIQVVSPFTLLDSRKNLTDISGAVTNVGKKARIFLYP